jgi:methyl-accepting chemotaxis protein
VHELWSDFGLQLKKPFAPLPCLFDRKEGRLVSWGSKDQGSFFVMPIKVKASLFKTRQVPLQLPKLDQLSLKQVLQFSMMSFLFLLTAMVLGVKWQESSLLGAGPRINYTGRQRMLTERMNHFAFSYALHQLAGEEAKVQKDLAGLQKTRKAFGDSLDALIHGGTLSLAKGGSQKIDAVRSEKIEKPLKEGLKIWKEIQAALGKLISPSSKLETREEALGFLEPQLSRLKGYMNQATLISQKEAEASLHFFVIVVWAGLFIGVLLSFFLKGFFRRKILLPLQEIRRFTEQVASGDVSQELEVPGCADCTELGQLVVAVNGMSTSLKELLADVKNTSCDLAEAAEEITATSGNMFEAVEQQVRVTHQVKAAFGEMVHAISEVAHNSSEAAGSATQAGESAQQGGQVVSGTIQGMHTIRDTVVDSAQAVERLGEHSQTIGKVIEVINDIAEQTNLLALNATIEAARAGEHGRGFAVVADEVRQLAERTTDATTEIADAIQSMQNETVSVVKKMQDGTAIVESGVHQAVDAEKALQQIVGSTDIVASKIEAIAAAAEEQSATVNEISSHVDGISEGADVSKAGAEEVVTAATRLSQRAESLNTIVGHFRT